MINNNDDQQVVKLYVQGLRKAPYVYHGESGRQYFWVYSGGLDTLMYRKVDCVANKTQYQIMDYFFTEGMLVETGFIVLIPINGELTRIVKLRMR